jgi:hypothetical protein
MRTLKTIRVGKGALFLRSSGQVYWVRDLEAARHRGGSPFARYDHGVLLVTSAPGCDALGAALKEMATAVRELKT